MDGPSSINNSRLAWPHSCSKFTDFRHFTVNNTGMAFATITIEASFIPWELEGTN